MAYIPPHKRYTGDTDKPDPTPALLAPQFRKNLSLGPLSDSLNRAINSVQLMGKFKYSNSAKFRWFAVGLTNDDVLPFPVSLQLVPSGSVKSKDGERLILVNTEFEKTTEVGSTLKSPWVIIAENVLQDLLSSFLDILDNENENENNDFAKEKPALVARFGKFMFHRMSSVNIETGDNNALPLSTLRNLRRTFYTNLPSSYLENITTGVAQEIGLDVEEEKESYLIQLYDKEQPDATISCKCKVTPDGRRLELLKIELAVRHAAIDIACLTKKLDLRLDLYTMTKRNITTFNDVEKHSLQDLVNSAVLDSNIKGGLRWPLGKDCSVDCRYRVVGVWHTKAQYFKNSNLRLRVRSADRFDFRTSTGELSWEVILQLSGMVSKTKESNIEKGSLLEVLADSIKVIWNHFLHCDNYLSIDSSSTISS
ncbi:unnamed protein product [Rhodiola kirilowii]